MAQALQDEGEGDRPKGTSLVEGLMLRAGVCTPGRKDMALRGAWGSLEGWGASPPSQQVPWKLLGVRVRAGFVLGSCWPKVIL